MLVTVLAHQSHRPLTQLGRVPRCLRHGSILSNSGASRKAGAVHLDLKAGTLQVRSGKGMQDRELPLERKAIRAVKSYLDIRPRVSDDHLFLNQYGEPISHRGIQKLVTKYTRAAGIKKKTGVHALRHTFATIKAKQGVSPFRMRKWLGHARIDT